MAISENGMKEFLDTGIERVFYFCLRKTGDVHQAEELASDITLQILNGLSRGITPVHFHGWMWKIARNRYHRWYVEKQKHSNDIPMEDIECSDEEISGEDTFRHLEDKEELAALRRELAFVSSDYRNILVAYYFENRTVKDIAHSLGVPEGTITSELHRARNLLKEGMSMARTFGTKSYNPQEVRFVNSGRFGDMGQPWSILNHLMYKNIFLEVYGNPQTAKELALALGIALPYMENELEFLVEQTFLSKQGERYTTTFPIISSETQTAIHQYNLLAAKEITAKLTALLDLWYGSCQNHGVLPFGEHVSYEDAKWALLPMAFDRLLYTAVERAPCGYTHRPDGGEWDIVGFQTTDFPVLPFVGQHTSSHTRCDLPEISFGQFKFKHDNICDWTPNFLTHEEAFALRCIAKGAYEKCEPNFINRLLEYGYIRKTDDGYYPTILVLKDTKPPFTQEENQLLSQRVAEIRGLFAQTVAMAKELVGKDIPKMYCDNERMVQNACASGGLTRSYVIEQALETGWLTLDQNTSRTIGAYIHV